MSFVEFMRKYGKDLEELQEQYEIDYPPRPTFKQYLQIKADVESISKSANIELITCPHCTGTGRIIKEIKDSENKHNKH